LIGSRRQEGTAFSCIYTLTSSSPFHPQYLPTLTHVVVVLHPLLMKKKKKMMKDRSSSSFLA
jgi:hypothetical protein